MIYTCLNNWIGVNDGSSNTSDSGVYINDLSGVELLRLNQLINDDDSDYSSIWEKVRDSALRKFSSDVTAEFSKRYKLKSINQSLDFGRIVDTSTTTASGAFYRGFIKELNDSSANYTESNLKLLSIGTVKIYMSSAESTTVKVFDLDTKEELYTTSVTGVIGWNTVKINQQFDSYRVFVCYDSTNITSVKLDVSQLSTICVCDGNIRGASATIADPYTVTKGNDSFGLSAVISEQCSFQKLICNNKYNFTTPLLYLMGIALCNEALFSDTISPITTSDRPRVLEFKTRLELDYYGGQRGDEGNAMKVKGALETAIEGVNLNLDDECLECNATMNSTYAKV